MNRSVFQACVLLALAAAVVMAASKTIADDGPARDRQLAEMQEQLEQMRAVMEELRALLREVAADREEVKPDGEDVLEDMPGYARERMQEMKREIQALRDAGREDEANAVEREAQALLERFAAQQAEEAARIEEGAAVAGEEPEWPRDDEEAEREESIPPEAAQRLEALEREIDDLREAGRLDAAERLQREIDEIRGRLAARAEEYEAAEREEEWYGDEAESRLDHLRAAAEHLEAAGAPDLTERVRGLIEEIERDRRE
jgi:hypothetical protein